MTTQLHSAPELFGSALTADEKMLLVQARLLYQARQAGQARAVLRNRHFALVAGREDTKSQQLFRRAVEELGGRMSLVRAPAHDASPAELRDTAALLGRLYDAVEYEGTDKRIADQLMAHAGVPVFEGLATARHVTARLASSIVPGIDVLEGHHFVVQAVLLGALR